MRGVLRDGLVRMMPQLRAEEDARLAGVTAFATGNMQKRDARKFRRQLNRELGGSRGVRKASSVEEHHANLAALGFTVVVNGEAVAP